jgi:hypothetical protein
MTSGVTMIAANVKVRTRNMSVMHMVNDKSHIVNVSSIGIPLTSKKITVSAAMKQIISLIKNLI